MSFTKGPWKLALDFNISGRILGDDGAVPIADVLLADIQIFGKTYTARNKADAKLIAAAPEMLSLLKSAAYKLDEKDPSRLGHEIKSLIAKIEGDV